MALDRSKQERGAKDDWEALKIVLDSHPSLKQRVLYKLRELKKRKENSSIKVSVQDQKEFMRDQAQEKKNRAK